MATKARPRKAVERFHGGDRVKLGNGKVVWKIISVWDVAGGQAATLRSTANTDQWRYDVGTAQLTRAYPHEGTPGSA